MGELGSPVSKSQVSATGSEGELEHDWRSSRTFDVAIWQSAIWEL